MNDFKLDAMGLHIYQLNLIIGVAINLVSVFI